jgi:uncharacterized protein YjbI with pentapeptide repeats
VRHERGLFRPTANLLSAQSHAKWRDPQVLLEQRSEPTMPLRSEWVQALGLPEEALEQQALLEQVQLQQVQLQRVQLQQVQLQQVQLQRA